MSDDDFVVFEVMHNSFVNIVSIKVWTLKKKFWCSLRSHCEHNGFVFVIEENVYLNRKKNNENVSDTKLKHVTK